MGSEPHERRSQPTTTDASLPGPARGPRCGPQCLRLQSVRAAPLFQGLGACHAAELVSRSRLAVIERRATFFSEGAPVRELGVLCCGRVKVTQRGDGGPDVILRLLGPGEVMGPPGLLDESLHSTRAEALEHSECLFWERREFEGWMHRWPVLHRNAVLLTAERLRGMQERYRELVTEGVARRLSRTLVRLATQIGLVADDGVLIALSREELGQMAGTTLFTVSRMLSAWESHGLLLGGREEVRLLDLQGLAGIAGPG